MADVFRKKKNGAEYGNYFVYAGGRIVNLNTADLSLARTRAAGLRPGPGAGVVNTNPAPSPRAAAPGSARSSPAAPPTGEKRSPFTVLSGGAAAEEAPPPADAAPVQSFTDQASSAGAKIFAKLIAKANLVADQFLVAALKREPPPATDDDVDTLAKLWEPGIAEWMRRTEFKWYYPLVLQNAVLVMDMWRRGKPIVVTAIKPVVAKEPPPPPAGSEGAPLAEAA